MSEQPCENQEELLSVLEAAEYLKVSQRTVLRHIENGTLRAGKIGRVWRIRCADIKSFLHREDGK